MIIAGLLLVIGFLSVAVLTQWYGYRLGGTITVGTIAVYTLKDVVMLPLFVLSTALAYVGLSVLRERTLIYGRTELLAAIFVGSIIPLGTFLLLALSTGATFRPVLFIGSILPGLTAFNYHQIKPGQRRGDVLAFSGLLLGLLALGYVLVTPTTAARIGTLTPPVLFSQTADIAVFKSAVVTTPPEAVLIPRRLGAFVLLAGMVFAEVTRSRFGIRVGVVSLALLAIYALASVWLLVVFALVLVVTFLLVETINRTTLVYGRALIGISAACAVALAIPLAIELPVVRGLSALFAGILGGLGGYNLHVTAGTHRRTFLALSTGIFLPLLALALLVGQPQPNALVQALTPATLGLIGVLTLAAFGIALWFTPELPDDESVFAASILNSGDGA